MLPNARAAEFLSHDCLHETSYCFPRFAQIRCGHVRVTLQRHFHTRFTRIAMHDCRDAVRISVERASDMKVDFADLEVEGVVEVQKTDGEIVNVAESMT